MSKTKVAVIGSGNIGTDLVIKLKRVAQNVEIAVLVGIDPSSDGLARARRMGIDTVDSGVQGLIEHPDFADIDIIFDSTSAKAHVANEEALRPYGKRLIDLTPAAIGPYVVPAVNLDEHLAAPNVNMVTCGGQATIPIVAAISEVTAVHYAEIVASIASKSAGPGTRANIDEFTETTSEAIEKVGGAAHGKAIIVLNPAEPPLIMRDTVLALVSNPDQDAIRRSIMDMVAKVSVYVPGYRLKQEVQFTELDDAESVATLTGGVDNGPGMWKVSVFLEVEGAAHYLPAYAGNLDIMTAAAARIPGLSVTLRYIDESSDIETGELMAFVGPHFVVTVRRGEPAPLEQVRSALEHDPTMLEKGPMAVLYSVMDAVVDRYRTIDEELSDDVVAIEHRVFTPGLTTDVGEIYALKRELLEARWAVQPLIEPARRLLAARFVPDEFSPFFRDIQDPLLIVHEHIETYDRLLSDVLSAHLAQVSVRQNDDMRKISAWVAIASVPTMLAGIYGMNFHSMPELEASVNVGGSEFYYGYYVVLAVLVTACVLLWRTFKRTGWL